MVVTLVKSSNHNEAERNRSTGRQETMMLELLFKTKLVGLLTLMRRTLSLMRIQGSVNGRGKTEFGKTPRPTSGPETATCIALTRRSITTEIQLMAVIPTPSLVLVVVVVVVGYGTGNMDTRGDRNTHANRNICTNSGKVILGPMVIVLIAIFQ